MPIRRQGGNLRRWFGEISISHHHRHAVRRGLQIASQKQAERRSFGSLAQWVGSHIEIANPAGCRNALRAVAVSKPPNAAPSLKRAQRPGQDASHPAESAWRRIIVLRASERLVEQ